MNNSHVGVQLAWTSVPLLAPLSGWWILETWIPVLGNARTMYDKWMAKMMIASCLPAPADISGNGFQETPTDHPLSIVYLSWRCLPKIWATSNIQNITPYWILLASITGAYHWRVSLARVVGVYNWRVSLACITGAYRWHRSLLAKVCITPAFIYSWKRPAIRAQAHVKFGLE